MNNSTDENAMQLINDAAESTDTDIARSARVGLQNLLVHRRRLESCNGSTIGAGTIVPDNLCHDGPCGHRAARSADPST